MTLRPLPDESYKEFPGANCSPTQMAHDLFTYIISATSQIEQIGDVQQQSIVTVTAIFYKESHM